MKHQYCQHFCLKIALKWKTWQAPCNDHSYASVKSRLLWIEHSNISELISSHCTTASPHSVIDVLVNFASYVSGWPLAFGAPMTFEFDSCSGHSCVIFRPTAEPDKRPQPVPPCFRTFSYPHCQYFQKTVLFIHTHIFTEAHMRTPRKISWASLTRHCECNGIDPTPIFTFARLTKLRLETFHSI